MPPMTYGCVLCGFVIRPSTNNITEQWQREYRAVYAHPSGHSVTGVGCFDGDAEWIPPSDPTRRWDDADSPQLLELPVMQSEPEDGRHGFVLHDACWMLMRSAWGPEDIRVGRLVDICKSIPFPLSASCLAWQHGYGGLLRLDAQKNFEWQEIWDQPREIMSTRVFLDAYANPLDVPDMSAILSSCAKAQPDRGMKKTARDCFSRLPWELRETIATFLTAADALSLRQASASFLPLFSSTHFWASRFTADWERKFVFEVHRRREPTDWLELYRLTSPKSGPTGLRNRCRIWSLIKPLIEAAKLDRDEPLARTSEQALAPSWSQVTGDLFKFDELESNRRRFNGGCCSLCTIAVPVPDHLLRIGVSTNNLGDTYVTGLRFVVDGEPDVRVGYISSNEAFFALQGLCGFKVAAAPSGLRALQIVGKGGHRSQWIGCPGGIPVSKRLAGSLPIEAVTIRLDGFKIVGLGVSAPAVAPDQGLSFRETALWYPCIPPKGFYLNEGSFTGQDPCQTSYRPLVWNHFGGHRGSYLKHIVGLSIQSLHRLQSLEFVYNGVYDGCSSNKLGRCGIEIVHPGPRFTIDGTAGELIESIDVHVRKNDHPRAYDFLKQGIPKCFKVRQYYKIKTNRGREFASDPKCDHPEMQPMKITAGTTITGFYTTIVSMSNDVQQKALGTYINSIDSTASLA